MSAHQNYPEFSGYRPRVFPGTPAAREVRYEPRRMNLPPGAESDWKKMTENYYLVCICSQTKEGDSVCIQ